MAQLITQFVKCTTTSIILSFLEHCDLFVEQLMLLQPTVISDEKPPVNIQCVKKRTTPRSQWRLRRKGDDVAVMTTQTVAPEHSQQKRHSKSIVKINRKKVVHHFCTKAILMCQSNSEESPHFFWDTFVCVHFYKVIKKLIYQKNIVLFFNHYDQNYYYYYDY